MSRNAVYKSAPANDEELDPRMPDTLRRQEFARNLYRLMVAKNWRQSDLARASGLGRDSISGYMRGRNMPEPTSAQRLADALGVTVEQLYPGSVERAIDHEMPSLEFRQAAGHPGRVWLRVNRMVPFGTASRTVSLLQEADEAEEQKQQKA